MAELYELQISGFANSPDLSNSSCAAADLCPGGVKVFVVGLDPVSPANDRTFATIDLFATLAIITLFSCSTFYV